MMIFYLLTLVDLTCRMAIMISLNFRAFFATENLVLSVICLELALMVGTSNAFILTSLTIDLKTLKCKNEEDRKGVARLSCIYRILLYIWTFCIIASCFLFFFLS